MAAPRPTAKPRQFDARQRRRIKGLAKRRTGLPRLPTPAAPQELSIMDHWSAEARLLQADESGDVPWTYRQTSLLIEPAWQVLP